MPKWNDLGTALATLRELDVSAIREEAERDISIVCLGPQGLFAQATQLLLGNGSRRYGPAGGPALHHLAAPAAEGGLAQSADVLLVLLDGRRPLPAALAAELAGLARLALPTVIAICHAEQPGELGAPRPEFAHARIVVLPDLSRPASADLLAEAIADRLPGELGLAAARRLPALRPPVARELLNSVSFTNASYAAASALPEQIPILSVPFAAADILVLTKNQALLVYRLALAHGAPPDFQERIREVLPVIGGAFVWRQLARTLVGLIPIWGVVPKVAIAYAGTYTTGVAAWRWFADGEVVSGERLRAISQEALAIGRERARALVAAARTRGSGAGDRLRRGVEGLRARLPGGRRPERS